MVFLLFSLCYRRWDIVEFVSLSVPFRSFLFIDKKNNFDHIVDLHKNHVIFMGGGIHGFHMVSCCFPCATANGICFIPLVLCAF